MGIRSLSTPSYLRYRRFTLLFVYLSSIIMTALLTVTIPTRAIVLFVSSHGQKIDELTPAHTPLGLIRLMVGDCIKQVVIQGRTYFLWEATGKLLRGELPVLTRDDEYKISLREQAITPRRLTEIKAEMSGFKLLAKISIILPVYNTSEQYLRRAIESVLDQVYPLWELCLVGDGSTDPKLSRILLDYASKDQRIRVCSLEGHGGVVAASNHALRMTAGQFVGLMNQNDELTPDACLEVVKALNDHPDTDLLYSDQDKLDELGERVEPFFKPDWSPDLLMSLNYISHFSVVRRSMIEKVGGFREGFEGNHDYDLFLRVTEVTNNIWHIPRILYSQRQLPHSDVLTRESLRVTAMSALREALARRGLKGDVSGGFGCSYRVRYSIENAPLVSIIIPTRNRVDLLQRCITSLESKTHYANYEIIIVDNNSEDKRALTYLGSLRHEIIRFEGEFNFSRINNLAAARAKGDHLLFLNNDTEVLDGHWLEAMIEHSQRPEVGVVGTLLLYPQHKSMDKATIQHAGVIVGPGGLASHAFTHYPAGDFGYFGLHRLVRNCSAVTGACLMIKRKLFNEVDGFDEKFRVDFGDVDLCLRVLENGYRIIYTPYAAVWHHESATRRGLHPDSDVRLMINRWKDFLIKGDPYYNNNFTLLRTDYSISPNGSMPRPLSLLMDIYNLRPDLRADYPEASRGDYRRLIEWAVIRGPRDKAWMYLQAYASYYYFSHPTSKTYSFLPSAAIPAK
jgi:GT2 family glycosyltransferase